LRNTLLTHVNESYATIQGQLPEDIPDHIKDVLEQVENYIHNASSSANSIYVIGELRKAIELLDEVSSSL